MRLISISPNGDISLTEELTRDIPPYAILSHTWGEDRDEVTFKDMTLQRDHWWKRRKAAAKITFCTEQALRDGLNYLWVDTCCIDKSSSVELSEAINSMYRWYRNAAKCYVYMADVLFPDPEQMDLSSWRSLESTFLNSRWFTRGWTLQELLASRSVEFYSSNERRLGDKESLVQQIHEKTGIPISALQGEPLTQFPIEEKMLWTEGRQTKRDEDMVYCLLGIFGVFLPPMYGEGQEHAFRRLRQEIRLHASERDEPMPKIENLQIAKKENLPRVSESTPAPIALRTRKKFFYPKVYLTVVYWEVDGFEATVQELCDVFKTNYHCSELIQIPLKRNESNLKMPWTMHKNGLHIVYYLGDTYRLPYSNAVDSIVARPCSITHFDWLGVVVKHDSREPDTLVIIDGYVDGLDYRKSVNAGNYGDRLRDLRVGVIYAGYVDRPTKPGELTQEILRIWKTGSQWDCKSLVAALPTYETHDCSMEPMLLGTENASEIVLETRDS